MADNIQIIEKPDWVTWDDIKQCLVEAHAVNRAKGINMSHYQWDANNIGGYIEESGVIFIALDSGKVVGTLGIKERQGNYWFVKGRYGYLCFGSLLPNYQGLGIYKKLNEACEEYARSNNLNVVVLDTHSKNKHMHAISKRGGYQLVRFFLTGKKDHFSVMMAKWLIDAPFSSTYCQYKYFQSMIKTMISHVLYH